MKMLNKLYPMILTFILLAVAPAGHAATTQLCKIDTRMLLFGAEVEVESTLDRNNGTLFCMIDGTLDVKPGKPMRINANAYYYPEGTFQKENLKAKIIFFQFGGMSPFNNMEFSGSYRAKTDNMPDRIVDRSVFAYVKAYDVPKDRPVYITLMVVQ